MIGTPSGVTGRNPAHREITRKLASKCKRARALLSTRASRAAGSRASRRPSSNQPLSRSLSPIGATATYFSPSSILRCGPRNGRRTVTL